MSLVVTFTLDDETVQSYLDHLNAETGSNLTVETLSEEQRESMAETFGELAEGEIRMRTDDHSGFETDSYFNL